MNGKKAKAIRRAMRKELKTGSTCRPIFHASTYINQLGGRCLRYRAQYITYGGEQLVKLGKKIYNISGVLPKENVNEK